MSSSMDDTTAFGTSPFHADPTGSSRVEGGRHPINVGQLVMGIAFLGLVAVWGAIEADWIGDDDIRWLLPVPWVLAGLAGLLAVALGGRRRHEHPAAYRPYAAPYSTPEAASHIPTEQDEEQDR
jgi:hypothetical protein